MDNSKSFDVIKDGVKYKAIVIMNFSLYDAYYCIYGIKNGNRDYDVYCGKIIGDRVVPIENEKDRDLTNKIVLAITNVVKEGVQVYG